jgi:hypothetical protein
MDPIPTTTQKKDAKKALRDARYAMYVDISQTSKSLLTETTDDELQQMLGSMLQLMNPPEDLEQVEVPAELMKQTALLACVTLSRYLHERSKK